MTPLEIISLAIENHTKASSEQQLASFNHLLGQIEAVIEFGEGSVTKQKLAGMVKSAVKYGTK